MQCLLRRLQHGQRHGQHGDGLAAGFSEGGACLGRRASRPGGVGGRRGLPGVRDAAAGIMLLGGFLGDPNSPTERDPSEFETVLDGNHSGSVVTVAPGAQPYDTLLDGFTVQNGTSSLWGGGACCFNSAPTISNNTFQSNSAAAGGGIYCYGSAHISGNDICQCQGGRGGGIDVDGGDVTISRNLISENEATQGTGIYGGGTICNNLIIDNHAIRHVRDPVEGPFPPVGSITCLGGGAIYNNTIVGDYSLGSTGIYCYYASAVAIVNNVIRNTNGGIDRYVSQPPILSHNDIWNPGDYGCGSDPYGNICADPCFVGSGDYQLQPGSPCIDVGDPNTNLALVGAVDFYGNSRVSGACIDIGAAESSSIPCYLDTPIVTAPVGTIGDLSPSVSWTINAAYDRCRIIVTNVTNPASPVRIWDSGQVMGGTSPAQIGQTLTNGSTYSVAVEVGNACAWSAWSNPVTFTINFTEAPLPRSVTYCQ